MELTPFQRFQAIILFFTLCVAGFCCAVTGAACKPAAGADAPDRAAARATILTMAAAVHEADAQCASYVQATKELDVAEKCAAAYDVARNALMSSEYGVDAWESADHSRIACSVGDAALALQRLVDVLELVHVAVPAVVRDALALAPNLRRICHG